MPMLGAPYCLRSIVGKRTLPGILWPILDSAIELLFQEDHFLHGVSCVLRSGMGVWLVYNGFDDVSMLQTPTQEAAALHFKI